jgi:hypothetical protein
MPVGLSPNAARISNYKRVAISLFNLPNTKHRTAWRPISLLARSLFRPLEQSQAQ